MRDSCIIRFIVPLFLDLGLLGSIRLKIERMTHVVDGTLERNELFIALVTLQCSREKDKRAKGAFLLK
jgi:hypothetical protein